MSELSEGLLIFMTGVLALATFILAYHAWRLWKVTKEVAQSAEKLKLMPKLVLDTIQPLSNTKTFCRFSVKNIGFGSAINMEAHEGDKKLEPVLERQYIVATDIYNWDIPDAKVGQVRTIEVKYADIRGGQPQRENIHVKVYTTT